MKPSPDKEEPGSSAGSDRGLQRSLRLVLAAGIGLGLLLVAVLVWHRSQIAPPAPPLERPAAGSEQGPEVAPPHAGSLGPSTLEEFSVWDTAFRTPPTQFDGLHRADLPPATASLNESSRIPTDQLLTRVQQMMIDHGSFTAEQAEQMNQLLDQMPQRGEAIIPLIREYLDSGQDLNFDTLPGGELVSYPTLRVGLVDVLLQVGGPEALVVVGEALVTATDPLEIGLLAHELERQVPGEYRDLAIAAARDILAGGLVGGHDPAPLFEVLQTYGDAAVTNDLEQAAGVYGVYVPLALANLADGVGVPSLTRLAQDPLLAGTRTGNAAFQMLAQVTMRHPAAREALSSEPLVSRVPDHAWPTVAKTLAGSSYLRYGNPLYGSSLPPYNWSPDEIRQQIQFIDQLIAATPSLVGRRSLQEARQELLARLQRQNLASQ